MTTQAITKQIRNIEYTEKQIFWTLFVLFVFFLVSYGFLINKTIGNAIAKENMQKEMSMLNSEVNSREFQYLNIKNSITMNLALSKGFVAVPNNNFALLSPSRSLSLSINER